MASEVLEKTAGRQEACASLPCLLVFQKSVLCESRTLNNGELLSCCRLCLSEKQEASSASKLPVLQLCSPSSVRKEQIVRHVRGTQRTTKLSLPVRKIFEAVSDLLFPSVSWQPVYAAEGRPVTLKAPSENQQRVHTNVSYTSEHDEKYKDDRTAEPETSFYF